MSEKKDGKILKYPTEVMNAVAAAEKAAELVEQASREFLEGLNREYRLQTRGRKARKLTSAGPEVKGSGYSLT